MLSIFNNYLYKLYLSFICDLNNNLVLDAYEIITYILYNLFHLSYHIPYQNKVYLTEVNVLDIF